VSGRRNIGKRHESAVSLLASRERGEVNRICYRVEMSLAVKRYYDSRTNRISCVDCDLLARKCVHSQCARRKIGHLCCVRDNNQIRAVNVAGTAQIIDPLARDYTW
jgi:hypothetical protein